MRNFQKKKGLSHFLHSIPFLFILGLGVMFFAYSMVGLIGKMQETSQNKKNAEDKLIELQNNKEKLSSEITKLNTTLGLEEDIRERFGLVKEGENVIVIVEDKKDEKTQLEANSGGFFSFFINLFK